MSQLITEAIRANSKKYLIVLCFKEQKRAITIKESNTEKKLNEPMLKVARPIIKCRAKVKCPK